VLQSLILNRAPQTTLAWAQRVAGWDFQRLIPCHFDSPLTASPQQFLEAFAFLEKSPTLPEVDFALLRQLDAFLRRWGVIPDAAKSD
jgi:hypothetical protein